MISLFGVNEHILVIQLGGTHLKTHLSMLDPIFQTKLWIADQERLIELNVCTAMASKLFDFVIDGSNKIETCFLFVVIECV